MELENKNLPRHIAFIIDGNGRWAKKRGLKRTLGHKQGVEALKTTIDCCLEFGIEVVSFYCFSTENWNRPEDEVKEIFDLFNRFFQDKKEEFSNKNIKVIHSGDLNRLDSLSRKNILDLEERTNSNSGLICNICVNYGSRQEIVRAVNKLISQGKKEVSIEDIQKNLYTKDIGDPDFIVRTSGEQRLSNFMLFQSAYAEFYFPEILWPDFDRDAFIEGLNVFKNRNRRYGNINK